MVLKKAFALSAAALALMAGTAFAHELILKSEMAHPAKDQAYGVDVVSTHVFIVPDEIEDASSLTMGQLVDGKLQTLELKPDEARKVLVAQAKGDGATQVFGVARTGVKFAVTNKGGKGGKDVTRKGLEDEGLKVKSINMYDKYSKAIVNAKADDESYKALVGHDVEFELLKNPAEVKVGEFLPVRVLHHGSPESANVYATYDGFVTDHLNTYAYYTEGDPEGVAYIKITAPGTWMLRTESEEGGKDGDYDKRIIRTSCTFNID